MALFGCSPLLLTLIADHFFTTQTGAGETVLNVTRFLTCLSLVTGLSHILGAVTLPGRSFMVPPSTSPAREDEQPSELDVQEGPSMHREPSSSSETTPLLGRRSLSPSSTSSKKSVTVEVDIVEVQEVSPPQHGSTLDLVRDPWFLGLLVVVAIVVGCVSSISSLLHTVTNMQPSVRDGHRKPFAHIPFSPELWRSVSRPLCTECTCILNWLLDIDPGSVALCNQHTRKTCHRTPRRLYGPGTSLLFAWVWIRSSK